MTGILIACCAVLGLAVGSFLNVVVWRVPRGESVIRPPSACPECGHRIRPRDNVPVLSWLLLRGRCRDCGAPISARYPAVEGCTALAFAGVAAWFGPSWALPAFLYLAAISVALTLIDIDVQRLPDPIVLPSYLVGAATLLLPVVLGETGWDTAVRAGLGLAAMWLVYFVVWLIGIVVLKKLVMGAGDVKLSGVLGLYLGYLGWPQLVAGYAFTLVLGGLVAVLLLVLGKRGVRIPYGPYMIVGAWLAVPFGQPVAQAYLSFTGLA